jgi:hypothetical protein
MSRYSNANRDPREISARFDGVCAETGKAIRKGEACIYYPVTGKVFAVDSQQARKFREWKADLAMGYDY